MGVLGNSSGALGGTLAEEQGTEFFRWFHLEPGEEPLRPADRGAWRSFRPSGPAFHSRVRLDLLLGDNQVVIAAELRIARGFIEGRQSAFARDIAKSFLTWALKREAAARGHPVIENIADMGAANAPVIMRADAVPPHPAPDPTGGYAVFLGERARTATDVGGARVTLTNMAEADQSRWLIIGVAPNG
jgi:hypothetical protein